MKKWIKIFTFAYGQGRSPPYSQPDRRMSVLGGRQNLLSGFCPLRGFPPPSTPLTENHFAKKPLAEMGGNPPPPNGKLAKKFLKNGPKSAWLNRVKERVVPPLSAKGFLAK